jgi:hypothetical protein
MNKSQLHINLRQNEFWPHCSFLYFRMNCRKRKYIAGVAVIGETCGEFALNVMKCKNGQVFLKAIKRKCPDKN